jgi:hypothetical protein
MLRFIAIFLIIFSTFSCSLRPSGEGEIYFIPKGYKGYVFIFYNQKDGAPKEYNKNNFRIYRINNKGILKTQFDVNKGDVRLANIKFYYGDSILESAELRCHWTGNEPKDSFAIFYPKDGSVGSLFWSNFTIDSTSNLNKYDFGKVEIKDTYDSNRVIERRRRSNTK